MVTVADARRVALSLPEAVEQDHHGRPSFRVAGKIFATLWDEDHMNVMVDEPGILHRRGGAPGDLRRGDVGETARRGAGRPRCGR